MIVRTLKFLLSSALVALAIKLLDWGTIVNTVRNGSALSLVVAIFVNLLVFSTLGIRWYWMVVNVSRAPFLAHLATYLRATFLNTFTPANLGGDVYRVLTLKSPTLPATELVRLLIRERLIGLYGCLSVFALAWGWLSLSTPSALPMPFAWGLVLTLAAFATPAVALLSGTLVKKVGRGVFGPSRFPQMEGWVDTLANLFSIKGTLNSTIISIIGTLLWVASIDIVTTGLGLSIPFVHLAAVATLVEVVRLVPLTVQGIGVREGVFAYLLGTLGHDTGATYAAGAVAYLTLSISIVLAGPIGTLTEKLSGYFGMRTKT